MLRHFTKMKKEEDSALAQCFFIPQRYILGIMGFLGVVNSYTMRVALSVAITEMVKFKKDEMHYDPNACFIESQNKSKLTLVADETYDWTSKQQGTILSAFYFGYVITHIPGGIIAEKFGGKHTLGLGILCTSLFTLFLPVMTRLVNGNWIWVAVFRVIVGFGEGTTFPALTAILSKWVPESERSKIGTLVYSGSQIGTVIGTSISGALIAGTHSWVSVFYFFGAFGVIWYILFTFLCYSDPASHPFIKKDEKLYLDQEIQNISNNSKTIPWKGILTSVPLWALVCAQIGHDWGFFAMVTDLPKYMKEVLGFNVKENGLLSSLPYILMWVVSMSSGWFCDWLVSKNYLKTTTARKLFTVIASMGPATFILAASYTGCNRVLAVTMFTIGMGFMGTFYCGMKVNALDLSPNFSGILMAIVNGIGAISGILVPYLISAITNEHTQKQWRLVFWITFGVFAVTSSIFAVFGSGDVQPFNDIEDGNSEIQKTKQNHCNTTC